MLGFALVLAVLLLLLPRCNLEKKAFMVYWETGNEVDGLNSRRAKSRRVDELFDDSVMDEMQRCKDAGRVGGFGWTVWNLGDYLLDEM